MTHEKENLEAEPMGGAVGRHGTEAAGQQANWYSFSFLRTLRGFAITCALLWFFFILIILPSQATRFRPFTRELHIYITFLNVLIVLLVVRGWRAHLLFLPIWVALLWLFYI
jgi:hypothetical protein